MEFVFQRFIDEVLSNLDFVYACIVDVLIASKNEKQHHEHPKIIFQRLQKYSVVVNPSKYDFVQDRVLSVGHIVSSTGIMPSTEKVAILQNFPEHKSVKQLCIPQAAKTHNP